MITTNANAYIKEVDVRNDGAVSVLKTGTSPPTDWRRLPSKGVYELVI
jgi:hypothetical protein